MKKILNYFILTIVILANFIFNNTIVFASSGLSSLTPADYTNSDYLIGHEQSEDYDISRFSEYVNSLSAEDEILNLEKIIPISTIYIVEYQTTFYYMGKEYGYYLVKEGENFDLLLIDFKYGKYNLSNNQYVTRIEMLLQVSFERILVEENGSRNYHFYKTTGRPEYYIANPRFLTTIENPNELNTAIQVIPKKMIQD